MSNDDGRATIIIKKVKKGGHGGHHGGAWKVAYADFVTAMMAFFLLLWLLNVTTEEQRLGIADYFTPASVSRNLAGSDGVMGGQSMSEAGAQQSDSSPVGVTIQLPPATEEWEGETEGLMAVQGGTEDEAEPIPGQETTVDEKELEESDIERLMEELEAERFAEAEAQIRQTLESTPELKELSENLLIDQTPEGMRIQIVDKDGTSMFPSGSSGMYEHTTKLLQAVVDVIAGLENRIAIKGHTDATPFQSANGYSNWELSTDRANASRRTLIEGGLKPGRIESVVGRADQEPLIAEDPLSPQNRRISIILLRDTPARNLPDFQSNGGNN